MATGLLLHLLRIVARWYHWWIRYHLCDADCCILSLSATRRCTMGTALGDCIGFCWYTYNRNRELVYLPFASHAAVMLCYSFVVGFAGVIFRIGSGANSQLGIQGVLACVMCMSSSSALYQTSYHPCNMSINARVIKHTHNTHAAVSDVTWSDFWQLPSVRQGGRQGQARLPLHHVSHSWPSGTDHSCSCAAHHPHPLRSRRWDSRSPWWLGFEISFNRSSSDNLLINSHPNSDPIGGWTYLVFSVNEPTIMLTQSYLAV